MARKLPKVLESHEQAALLGAFNTRYDSALKNLCMVRLMMEAGLRVSEVCNLKPRNLEMMSCKLTIIQGKGSKDRVLWVSESLRDLIGEWLQRRPESEWLFPTNTGAQTDTRSVRRMMSTYGGKVGIDKEKCHPHTLRHTFATNLYAKTKNIVLTQKALGHSDVSTTMIYTHLVDGELEASMKAMA
jgi:integrase/recombinase XerD